MHKEEGYRFCTDMYHLIRNDEANYRVLSRAGAIIWHVSDCFTICCLAFATLFIVKAILDEPRKGPPCP